MPQYFLGAGDSSDHSFRCRDGGFYVTAPRGCIVFQDSVDSRETLINRLIGMHLRHDPFLCICVQECPSCPTHFVRTILNTSTDPDELESRGTFTCSDGSTRSLAGINWFIERDEPEDDAGEGDAVDDSQGDMPELEGDADPDHSQDDGDSGWGDLRAHSHMCQHPGDFLAMDVTRVHSEYPSVAEHIERLSTRVRKELEGKGTGVMVLVQDCPLCPHFFETVVSADTCPYMLRSFGSYVRPDGSPGELDGNQWYLSDEVDYSRFPQ